MLPTVISVGSFCVCLMSISDAIGFRILSAFNSHQSHFIYNRLGYKRRVELWTWSKRNITALKIVVDIVCDKSCFEFTIVAD